MTATHAAGQTARRASDSRALEILTRTGFVAYGLFHLTIAWLALQIALGHAPESGDQSGAFQLLAQQPGGEALLIVLVVGLAAMALWQALLAAVGHRTETGRDRVLERVASGVRAVIYAFLAWTAAKVVAGVPTSSGASQQHATAGVLGSPAGRWLVGFAGLVVIAVGIGLAVYGVRRSFEKRLRLGSLSRGPRQAVIRLGQVGYPAKGVAYGIVGVLLLQAAMFNDAARSSGLDGALHTLSGQPFGRVLLILVAIGFAAFGAFCFCQARYREV
jgi:hypothetical protein